MTPGRGSAGAERAAVLLALLLTLTGVLHLLAPSIFEGIVPPALGAPAVWVVLSGVAELACALGLVLARTRGAAGWATAALFVAVFPANVQMAVDALRGDGPVLISLLRLPIQVPLVVWAVHVAREAAPRPGAAPR